MPMPLRNVSVKAGPGLLCALNGVAPRAAPRTGLAIAKPASPRGYGSGCLSFYRTPKSNKAFLIAGTTKNSAGVALGGCTVDLFTTQGGGASADDALYATTVSDATTGAYAFSVPSNGWTFYAVAYKAGAPDVAGTTVNTLVGV